MEKYSPKGVFGRCRIYKHETSHNWILTIADRKTRVRWTVPWWDIKEMMCSETSPYVQISSLTVLTFYCPLRVLRQFGKSQIIPDCDTMRPDEKPMLQGIAKNWEKCPRIVEASLPEHLEMVSKHYLVWMTADSALVRVEARKAVRGGRVRENGSSSVARTSTSNVKDRLGPCRRYGIAHFFVM